MGGRVGPPRINCTWRVTLSRALQRESAGGHLMRGGRGPSLIFLVLSFYILYFFCFLSCSFSCYPLFVFFPFVSLLSVPCFLLFSLSLSLSLSPPNTKPLSTTPPKTNKQKTNTTQQVPSAALAATTDRPSRDFTLRGKKPGGECLPSQEADTGHGARCARGDRRRHDGVASPGVAKWQKQATNTNKQHKQHKQTNKQSPVSR